MLQNVEIIEENMHFWVIFHNPKCNNINILQDNAFPIENNNIFRYIITVFECCKLHKNCVIV